MSFKITGQSELNKKLDRLTEGVQKRAMISAVSAGLTQGKREIKNAVPGTMKDLRKAVGVRRPKFTTTGDMRVRVGKVGFGAGISRAKAKQMGAAAAASREGSGKPGVGISIANFGWWVFGTKERYHESSKHTGQARPGFRSQMNVIHSPESKARTLLRFKKHTKFKEGTNIQLHYTGKMPPAPLSPVKVGMLVGKPKIDSVVESKLRERLAAEAQKVGLSP